MPSLHVLQTDFKGKKKWKYFLPNAPRYPKQHCILDSSWASQLFLLVRATCVWLWVWNMGGMLLTGVTRSNWRKFCASATLSITNFTWTYGPPSMTDRRLAACVRARPKRRRQWSTFTSFAPQFPKKHCSLEDTRASLVCHSGKSNI